MARDGSGNYSRVEGPYINGAIADADEVNAELDDVGSALSDSINKAGTKAFAANQPMGGFKFTGLAAGSSNGDSLRYEQLTALSSVYQPLDATLTAFAGVSGSANQIPYFTGTDAFALLSIGTSGNAVGKLNAANTWSAQQTFRFGGTTIFDRTGGGTISIELQTGGVTDGYIGSAAASAFIGYQSSGTAWVTVADATGVAAFGARPTFNGNTPLDSANVATYALPIGGGTLTGQLNVGSNYFFRNDTTGVVINWDSNDYLQYDRTNNYYNYYIGGTLVLRKEATSITIGSGVTLQDASSLRYALSAPDIILEDQKASGTAGGTFTSGADRTRTLNTEVRDVRNECSLASNQFTLTAGVYYIEAEAGAVGVDMNQLILYNVTGTTELLRGLSGLNSNSYTGAHYALLRGTFTIAASQALELRHRCTTTVATNGFGFPSSLGTERYAQVRLWRMA